MKNEMILGIDLGGTNIRAGIVKRGSISSPASQRINALGSTEEVLENIFQFTDSFINPKIKAIGIGVPGLTLDGIAYDVYNIPSWKEVPLQQLMEQRYQIPVLMNNDANCFALGEFYFGKGQGHDSMTGLTIGTGLGSGIIINKKLYSGKNGGAGEFGMIPYLDHYFEYYASGQFFNNVYGIDGETVFIRAMEGSTEAIRMYEEMGIHLGNAINTMLYALDTELIVLGGSVRHAFSFFSENMWKQLHRFVYQKAVADLKIEVSDLDNSGILGAAALHYNL